ncbi:MAG: DUF1501 domain-containing protein [Planctomycetaceae bacterium]|jgi:hypothetical protein|nr:DUF1501 domain-containing protein [Planctomycetaceae bacterium]MBT6153261.1 DUF1501 domain-containing protein [Planctomycetaceae bacterium]MBT6486918.1 DUF1501 domain-containing protein [Planctomycetaceae bacterium]MBT6493602.1 DUF1501 domain-containing protein [Planctomycetaceae bacterium]
MLNTSQPLQDITRRELLQRVGTGVGSIALASLLADELPAAQKQQQPHFPPRVKNVIFLHMVGAPSQLDLFENKPALMENDGKECPKQYLEGAKFAFIRGTPKLLGSRMGFRRCGESGLELSNLLPHLGGVADEMAIIKTLHTEQFNHGPAQLFLHTGFQRFGRPTMGSWINYGLGTENANLPGFVVLITGSVGGAGNSMWGSGFLPTENQGVEFRSQGDPVLFLSNPKGISSGDRRRTLDSINTLNRAQLADVGDPEIATRITQYELAYRMQTSVPELMNSAAEPKHVHEMYGTEPGKASFANNCLLARRLVERGVRFVQLMDQGWDHHGSVFSNLPRKCKQVDQPIAALIRDLKQRGLLDETLVIWGAEFGRTPLLQGSAGKSAGRDHHRSSFCAWMAGGGVKGGTSVGKTDELGYFPVEDAVSMHDFHATIEHLLGIDHERLTFKYQGRDFRLTDIAGNVVEKLLV